MSSWPSLTVLAAPPSTTTTPTTPIPEEEEYYSSWSLFLICLLLILSLWTSYYLQIKRIRAIHETFVAIAAGSFVGLVVRLAPGTMIREMLVRIGRWEACGWLAGWPRLCARSASQMVREQDKTDVHYGRC